MLPSQPANIVAAEPGDHARQELSAASPAIPSHRVGRGRADINQPDGH